MASNSCLWAELQFPSEAHTLSTVRRTTVEISVCIYIFFKESSGYLYMIIVLFAYITILFLHTGRFWKKNKIFFCQSTNDVYELKYGRKYKKKYKNIFKYHDSIIILIEI